MIRLTREVRLSLEADVAGSPRPGPSANTWAGWPAAQTLCPFIVVRGTFEGEPDPYTGYLVDIRRIDDALRAAVLGTDGLMGERLVAVVKRLWARLAGDWSGGCRLVGLELQPTPFTRFMIVNGEHEMVSITQSFEFAASHRLACHGFSDEKNRAIFGKCSNPNGHGHNYGLEVTVRVANGTEGTQASFSLPTMERVVKEAVLDRLDHKHLNLDCPEFADVNPSVENIARVIWGLLNGRVIGGELGNIRVYETPKTWADYGAQKK